MTTLTFPRPARTAAHILALASLAALASLTLFGCSAANPSPSATTSPLTLEEQMVQAIDAGDVTAVDAVLAAGLSSDANLGIGTEPVTPLHRAAAQDQADIVTLLIARGATIDAASGGITPLMMAAGSGAGEATIAALLAGGADPLLQNARSYGMNALHYAARAGNVVALGVMLDTGVDINIEDPTKTTALIYAAYYGRTEAVTFLIAQGADVNVRDQWNTTARGWAIQQGFPEVAALVEAAGGVE